MVIEKKDIDFLRVLLDDIPAKRFSDKFLKAVFETNKIYLFECARRYAEDCEMLDLDEPNLLVEISGRLEEAISKLERDGNS